MRLPLVLLFLLATPATAARHVVDPGLIRAELEAAWSAVKPPGATMEIRGVPSVVVDGEEVGIEVHMLDGLNHPGPRAIAVSCRVDGRVAARGLANVVIRVRRPVWVTPVALTRGQWLDPSVLLSEERVFEREPRRLFEPEPDRVWRVQRDVEPGTVLGAHHVRRMPEVEAGAEILLVSRAGQAAVAVTGRARRSGDVGDTILVHNPITGAIVPAVIIDRGTAVLRVPEGREAR